MKALLAALTLLVALPAAADEPRPFERGSWQVLREAHAGRPVVVHFWGLTCGPCLVELPHWAALRRERPDLDLVLVAADPIPEDPEWTAQALVKAGLGGVESWSFADRFAERLLYEIDPTWRGELPRTLLIDPAGHATVISGAADLGQVRAWLDEQKRPAPG